MARKLSEFQRALVDATLADFAHVPAEEATGITPSPEFEEKAEDLIRKTKRTGWYYVNTALKRAILIAAIIGALATTAFAVPAIREAIIDFFIQDEGDHYGFTFDPNEAATAPDEIEQVYGPTYVPNGFEKVVEDASIAGVGLWWVNNDDQWIRFEQSAIPDDPTNSDWLGINSEDVTTKSILIGDYLVLVIYSDDIYTLVWTDNSYFYRLYLDNAISDSEMKNIFLSIKELPDILIVN